MLLEIPTLTEKHNLPKSFDESDEELSDHINMINSHTIFFQRSMQIKFEM